MTAPHARTVEDVLADLQSAPGGLSAAEAAARLEADHVGKIMLKVGG